MTQYVMVDNDGRDDEVTSTKASGPQQHVIDAGPTLGLIVGYSGQKTGNATYVVDNGPTLGIGRSTT